MIMKVWWCEIWYPPPPPLTLGRERQAEGGQSSEVLILGLWSWRFGGVKYGTLPLPPPHTREGKAGGGRDTTHEVLLCSLFTLKPIAAPKLLDTNSAWGVDAWTHTYPLPLRRGGWREGGTPNATSCRFHTDPSSLYYYHTIMKSTEVQTLSVSASRSLFSAKESLLAY